MIAFSLQSGSNGNCIYVESCGVKLLFDAGISGIDAERRLATHGRNIREIDAVILSHDHADHTRFAGVYQRKYGLPLYVTPKTLDIAVMRHRIGRLSDVHHFRAGEALRFGRVAVQTIPTPHDGADGSAFVITANEKRLGIMTDLGHAFEDLFPAIASLDAVFIESNYDPEMLERGSYPYYLKRRIQGPGGHLSNREAAELIKAGKGLKWACLAHLSEQNNSPHIALRTHREIVPENLTLYTAGRYRQTEILSV
ncbi:MAG: MBL fold metallo-hydrolase [Nitrospirae bacterium]|nr:MBL fold metallo-hydrolase [Nitrospirota bacterium]